MKQVSVRGAAILLASVVAGSATVAQGQQRAGRSPEYHIKRLATLPGGTSAQGTSINARGWVSGFSMVDESGSTMHAAAWFDSRAVDLGTLGGPNSAIAWPNHDTHGRFAGIAETAQMDPLGEAWSCGWAVFPGNPDGHICLAFFWKDGVMNALPTLGGVNGFGASMNNDGQVVGWAENTVHDPTCNPPQVLQFRAVLWQPEAGAQRELKPYASDPDSAATAINDQGQVVGISGLCSNAVGGDSARHAVMWDRDGTVMNIGNLGGVAWNTPMALNHRGDVVGFSDLPGDSATTPNFHAFLWTKEHGMRDLGTLYGQHFSEALGINDDGTVVGISFDPGFRNPHAFIWRDGKMQDLDGLTDGTSLKLISAQDINDRGEITGVAFDPETNSAPAFLAVPEDH